MKSEAQKPQRNNKNLLIFDMDGTLVDSSTDLAVCVNLTLNGLGLREIPKSTVVKYIGRGIRRLVAESIGAKHADELDRAIEIFNEHYAAHLLDHTKPYPGIVDVLDHYSKRKLAIVTNKAQRFTESILNGLELNRYFDLIAGREFVKNPKPSPDPILQIMEDLSAVKDESVIIGDMEIDMEAGQAAGIQTCAVTYGLGDAERLSRAGPDFVVKEPRGLIDLF